MQMMKLNLESDNKSVVSAGSNESKDISKAGFDNDDDFERFKENFVIKPYFIPEESYIQLVRLGELEEYFENKFKSNSTIIIIKIEQTNSKVVDNLKEITKMPSIYTKYIIPELQIIKANYSSYSSNSNPNFTKILNTDNPEQIKIKGIQL